MRQRGKKAQRNTLLAEQSHTRCLTGASLMALAVGGCLGATARAVPVFEVSPLTLALGSDGTQATFTVANAGDGWAWYAIASSAPWATVSPGPHVVGPAQANTHTVTGDRTGLSTGDYQAVVTVTVIQAPQPANLLIDPGIEIADLNTWLGIAAGGRSAITDTICYEGAKCAQMLPHASWDRAIRQQVTGAAGVEYRAEVWLLSEGTIGGARVRMRFLDAGGAQLSLTETPRHAPTAWTAVGVQATAPPATATVELSVYLDPDSGAGRVLCDAAFLVAWYDSDGDGVPDWDDLCPWHAGKSVPGRCGCAWPDVPEEWDADGNCRIDLADYAAFLGAFTGP